MRNPSAEITADDRGRDQAQCQVYRIGQVDSYLCIAVILVEGTDQTQWQDGRSGVGDRLAKWNAQEDLLQRNSDGAPTDAQ